MSATPPIGPNAPRTRRGCAAEPAIYSWGSRLGVERVK